MRKLYFFYFVWLCIGFSLACKAQTPTDSINEVDLGDAVVTAHGRSHRLSLDVGHKEVLSLAGIQKMACCTVAESFQNSASVSTGYSDAVSGTRQIRMLGLAGVYTQLLDESRPIMRGLGQPYALTYTPGDWLTGISVSKGAASVVAGHDALTGQINMEHRKPTDDERLHIGFYFNDMLRPELNLASAIPLWKDKSLSTIVLVHGAADTEWREMSAMDRNKDGFRDQPRTRDFFAANKWLYVAPNGLQLRWGGKVGLDSRLGGNTHFDGSEAMRLKMQTDWDKPSTLYGSNISNLSANAYVKMALPVGRTISNTTATSSVRSNVAFVADFDHFGTNAYFGLNEYRAEENSVMLSAIYNHYFTASTSAAFGLQSRLAAYNEKLQNRTPWLTPLQDTERDFFLRRRENELGSYAELTLHPSRPLTLIVGVRGDYNYYFNTCHFTPRGHLKWDIGSRTTLRASAGLGYRTANVLADNLGILATGRQLAFLGQSLGSPAPRYGAADFKAFNRQEKALTWGISLLQKFSLFGDDNASIAADFFRTRFLRSVIADQEYAPEYIYIYSTDALAYSNSWQADFNWTPLERFDVLCTFRYTQSRHTLNRPNGPPLRIDRALQSRYKGLLNLQYATRFRRWVFDATAQLNGPARIPTLTGNLADSSDSPAFVQLYAQITHKIDRFDLYAGCENIADYRQKNPIQSADAPFSATFNSLNVWGPLMGRTFYVGLRFNLY